MPGPLLQSDNRQVAAVATAIESACRMEVSVFKPGNVSLESPGHNMVADQFLASARAIATPMARPEWTVGERILAGVEATREVVDCNTNLGIILLFSPLIEAFYRKLPGQSLQESTQSVLGRLTVADAEAAYAAIRQANPGGLGDSPRHDVRHRPAVTLFTAMAEAASRDTIAQAYVKGYDCLFGLGCQSHVAAVRRWGEESWGALACYLSVLARYPDSHVQRKHGAAKARTVSETAAHWRDALAGSESPQSVMPALRAWDEALKREGINPGTSADLTAAVLLIQRLEEII